MKNTKSSVIIKDLALSAPEGIKDLTPLEIKKISGGMTFQFSYNSNGESYTYIDDGGEITEKGTRPEGFDPDGSIVTLPSFFTTPTPIFFAPVSTMFFPSFFGFLPMRDDTMEESTGANSDS